MPSAIIQRRTAAALLATACLTQVYSQPAWAAQPEPIAVLINRYKAEMRVFEAYADDLSNDEINTLADATYRPPLKSLREWKSPIHTMAGAIAALQFCVDDMADNEELELVCPLVNAALGYLKGAVA